MSYYGTSVQRQLHSILDALTKDAVTEIGKLIDDGSAVLRLEIFHSRKENETLRTKLRETERELESAREHRKKGRVEFNKDAFAARTRFGPPAEEEEDFRHRVAAEQSDEPLPECVIKKERLDEQDDSLALASEWRADILEAERSVGADWDSGLDGGVAPEVGSGPGAVPEPLQWAEPALMPGDGDGAYTDFRYADEGGAAPGRAAGEAPFKEELDMQPVWGEEAGLGIGPSHQGQYREEMDGRAAQMESADGGVVGPLFGDGGMVGPLSGGGAGAGPLFGGGGVAGPLRPGSVRAECPPLPDASMRRQSGPAPFLCPHCGKAFAWSASLKRHLQAHEQRRPFRCALCPQSFADAARLAAHQRSHKRDRQFGCATCGKRFFRKHHLSSHQRTHTGERPYCCRFCGKDYKQLSNLISHQRGHTGERPYTCGQCGKSFHRLDNLKAHQRVHTRVRKFVCSVAGCLESFDQKYLYENHQLSHVM